MQLSQTAIEAGIGSLKFVLDDAPTRIVKGDTMEALRMDRARFARAAMVAWPTGGGPYQHTAEGFYIEGEQVVGYSDLKETEGGFEQTVALYYPGARNG